MIGAIIAARMGSSRLPGKVLLELGGKPMLEWVVDAVLRSRVERVTVLVTPEPEDAAIIELCEALGVDTYIRRATNDVLGGFYDCATAFGFDPIVRVTADCPLISSFVITSVVNEYLEGCDYCSNVETRTYPRGLDVEVLSYATLKWLHENVNPNLTPWGEYHPGYREHVTLYIRSHPHSFDIRSVVLNLSKLRLTVDTQDEYDKLKDVFDLVGDDPTWMKVANLLCEYPEFASLETLDTQTKALGRVW
jgi:spore coat polysaccharide biosynthesis protein SpsF